MRKAPHLAGLCYPTNIGPNVRLLNRATIQGQMPFAVLRLRSALEFWRCGPHASSCEPASSRSAHAPSSMHAVSIW